jgi:hypothetical protein
VTTELPDSENVPIVRELEKLIKLNGGSGPTTLAKFNASTERHGLSLFMSWDANGELRIE